MSLNNCHGCGQQIHVTHQACPYCGAPQQSAARQAAPRSARGYDEDLKHILPVGRSGWAVASGYLAFFSILAFPAPFALATGLMALRDIRQHPEKLGKPRAIFGIVMGALGSLFLLLAFLGSR